MDTVKLALPASITVTITLTSLANSATGVAGRESNAISNASDLYWDYVVGGKLRTGNVLTGNGFFEIWAHAAVSDAPLYVDTLTGSDANVTFTSRAMLTNCMRQLAQVDTISSAVGRVYWMPPVSIREAFGFMPRNFGLVVINRTTGAASGVAGSNELYAWGRYWTEER